MPDGFPKWLLHFTFPPAVYLCIVAKLYMTHCDPTYCRPPGSSIHVIFQARTLKQVATGSNYSTSSLIPFTICLFHCSYSSGDEVVSHWSFDLHSPDGSKCWTTFPVLNDCLYVFFGEMSFQIFLKIRLCFYYWIVSGFIFLGIFKFRYIICKYFLWLFRLSFYFHDDVFLSTKF